MRCEECGAENREESTFCKECGASLSKSTPPSIQGEEESVETPVPETSEKVAAAEMAADATVAARKAQEGAERARSTAEMQATTLARVLSTAWRRRGPILMALSIVLMMAMVFAPWAFIRVEVLGLSLASRSFSGWDIVVARVLFFLLIIPLVISLMLVAGIGTRRRVVETHIITFFLGFLVIVWGATFGLSQLLKSLLKNIKVIQVVPAGAQIFTLVFLLLLTLGIIVTTYDRGRQLFAMGVGG
jgi:zinc-ribbon domain